MKKLLTIMLIVMSVLLSFGFVSYAEEADKPLGSSAYYVPVDSSEFELYVNQSGSLVVAGMDLIDESADVSMYATVSYKLPDGEMVVQDIRKMNAYKNNPMPCTAFEIDGYYAAFCDLYITFIDSDTLKPYVEAINVNEYFAIDFASYQALGVVTGIDYYTDEIEFESYYDVFDAEGYVMMSQGQHVLSVKDISYCEEYFNRLVNVTFVYNNYEFEVININADELGSVLEIQPDMLEGSAAVIGDMYTAVKYYETAESSRTTELYTDDNAKMYVNGCYVDNQDLAVYIGYDADIKFVENNGDKYYDAVLVTVYEHGIVEEVVADDPANSKIILANGSKIHFDFEDTEYIIDIVDKNGKEMALSDFAAGDVVAMVVGEAEYDTYLPIGAKYYEEKIKVINLGKNYVEGMITEASDSEIYIDDVAYIPGTFVYGNEEDVFGDTGYINSAILRTEGYFYLSMTGRIIGYEAYPVVKNYGYILQTNYYKSGFAYGWEIKMLTKDGISEFTLYTTVNINGTSYKSSDITSDYGLFAGFVNVDEHMNDAEKRIVDYELAANGDIKTLNFANDTSSVYFVTAGEYNKPAGRIGGKYLTEDVVVFDVSYEDADETKPVDADSLIDNNEYTGCLADETDDGWKFFVITDGDVEEAASGDDSGSEDVVSTSGYGYILQTNYSDTSMEPVWQIKLLTSEGIDTYSLYKNIYIDGNSMKSSELDGTSSYFADFTTRDDHQSNIDRRIVEYELAATGEIRSIDFIGADAVNKDVFSKDTNVIDGKTLAESAIVFDISSSDAYESKVSDMSCLIDQNLYAGYAAAKSSDGSYSLFVALDVTDTFSPSGGLMYVESVAAALYGEYDAVKVMYYTDASSEVNTAIFTEEYSSAKAGSNAYANLSKGDIFFANTNADGLVSSYVIVAELEGEQLTLNGDVISYLEACDEDVGFVYGYVSELDANGIITVEPEYISASGESMFKSTDNTNEYTYNVNKATPVVQVGAWDSNGVDMADYSADECYYVFVKYYDGDAVDIYSIGYPRSIPTDDSAVEET
ncbi:MAG: hypothetical protein IJ460_02760 [Clostridia bacterium]|nr:hypothetical protein [Clostridia bacterium]